MHPGNAPRGIIERTFDDVEPTPWLLRPAIGDVSRSDASGIPVRVPVLRNGTLIYVITVLVRPASAGPKEQKR